MDISKVFSNDVAELYGKDFYYSRRFAKGNFNVIKPHAHEHYEVYFLTRGSRRFFVKNKFYIVSEGDVVLIRPNTIHYTTASLTEYHERILLNFTSSYVPSELFRDVSHIADEVCITIPKDLRRQIEELFGKIAEEYQKNDKYSHIMKKSLLSELLGAFLRTTNSRPSADTSVRGSENAVDRLLEYISENLSSRITLDDAAAYTGFSKSHFSRVFKTVTGFTFSDYLRLQRLFKARHLLEKTRDSITEIAYDCGFMSSGYFSTVFKEYFGMSPVSYRKNKPDAKN